jgi:hypothetical protein
MLVCSDITQTIDNSWTENIHHKVKEQQKKCKKWPWPLNWFCKLVWTVIEWVETIVHVVIQVIVTTVCYFYQIIVAIIEAIIRLVVEIWIRFISLIDFLASLALILPIKNLRLHVVILRKSDNTLTATEENVNAAIKRTVEVLRERARIKVVPTVHVMHDASPHYALQIKADIGCLFDQFSDAGAYFRLVIDTEMPGLIPSFAYRIGTPIVAFVVEGVGSTQTGCSTGPLGDYVCIEGAAAVYYKTTLAHEICHACGLLHDPFDGTNLMYPEETLDNGMPSGTNLSSFQRAIVRTSTHVTYF